MKTIAFGSFWSYVRDSSKHLKIDSKRARIRLNIHPDRILLQEAHDIIEELMMMSRIYSEQ